MVYSTRRFVLNLALCYYIVFFSPFSIAFTSLGEERANLSVFHTFVGFALVWFCLLSLPLGVRDGLRLVIVALPGRFSYLLFYFCSTSPFETRDFSLNFIFLLLFNKSILLNVQMNVCKSPGSVANSVEPDQTPLLHYLLSLSFCKRRVSTVI